MQEYANKIALGMSSNEMQPVPPKPAPTYHSNVLEASQLAGNLVELSKRTEECEKNVNKWKLSLQKMKEVWPKLFPSLVKNEVQII